MKADFIELLKNMSEEPRKRQRIEDGESASVSDYQQDCVKSRLEEKRLEIQSLKKENQTLVDENSKLQSYISKFKSGVAKVIKKQHLTDLQSLYQAYTADLSYEFQPGSAFEGLITEDESIAELSLLAKSCIKPLLIAIEKFKSGYTQEDITRKITTLQDAYIKASFQFSEYKSEIQQLKSLNTRLNETITTKNNELEELKIVKENLNIKLIKSASALNCKCRCRCGARKNDDEEEYDDIKELKAEINKLREEKKYYTAIAEEKIEKLNKLQFEMEVSEERFVRTKAFKSLVSQAKNIVKNIESLKKTNEELQKTNEDFNDNKYKEFKSLIIREEGERGHLESQIQALHIKLANTEKERDEALSMLNLLKKEKVHQKTSSNYKYIIEDLEEEKNRLKKQLNEYLKEKNDAVLRLEEEQKKINELKDQLYIKEIELSKTTKPEETIDQSDSDINVRLKEYRLEINELKNQLKFKDVNISKNESAIRQLKQDLKNEKRNNENLINEIDVTGNAYEETMKKNKSLAAQLVEQEQNCIQLMNERLKENS